MSDYLNQNQNQNQNSSIPKSIRSHSITTQSTLTRSTSGFNSTPPAARTRSMTRLSLLAENKLSNIGRASGKVAQKEGSIGERPRRVLGEKTMNHNVQVVRKDASGEGLKRKPSMYGLDGGFSKKAKKEGKSLVRKDDDRTPLNRIQMPNSHPRLPTTPTKLLVDPEDNAAIKPTPARVLLSNTVAGATGSDGTMDDDVSPEIPSRFIARPPTPPRPHQMANPPTQRQTELVRSDPLTDETEVASAPVNRPEPPTTPSLSRSFQSISLAPQTPKSTAQTPKKVMASVSKFRSAPSPKVNLAPMKSPLAETGRPTLDSILEKKDGGMRQMTLTGMVRSTGDFGLSGLNRKVNTSTLDLKLLTERAVTADGDVDMDSSASTAIWKEKIKGESIALQSVISPKPTDPPVKRNLSTMPLPLPKSGSTAQNLSSMPPPSRIPSAIRPTRPAHAAPTPNPPKKLSGPSSIPASSASTSSLGKGHPSTSANPSTSAPKTEEPIRRKPSYPSSLGSGPLARPRDRLVSGPVLYKQRDGTLASQKEEDPVKAKQSPRSVSEPFARPRPSSSLSSSTSRREGLSLETSKSLAGLSDALNKLKAKKVEGTSESTQPRQSLSSSTWTATRTVYSSEPSPFTTSNQDTASSSDGTNLRRLSSVHRPRQSIVPSCGDVSMDTESGGHAGDRSLAAIMCSTDGGSCLKGVIAFVDVRTADGDDATPIFTDMLKSLGARVLSRLTESVTHIVYKSGKPTTLTWYRKQEEEERPHIVGISWVTRCKAKGERLGEEAFVVNVGEEDIFQKRRKSMEPKALARSTSQMTLDSSLNIASIRRKSLMYAPRISSPLKKAYHKPSYLEEE